MLIAPIVFCTIVHGVAQMADAARVGRVALKALVYFEIMTTVALVFGLVAINFSAPGQGMHIDAAKLDTQLAAPYLQARSRRSASSRSSSISCPIRWSALSPRATCCRWCSSRCWLVSRLSASAKPGVAIATAVDEISKLIFRMVQIVMRFAPLGVFGAMAFTVGQFGLGSLASLVKLHARILRRLPPFHRHCARLGGAPLRRPAVEARALLIGRNRWSASRRLRRRRCCRI